MQTLLHHSYKPSNIKLSPLATTTEVPVIDQKQNETYVVKDKPNACTRSTHRHNQTPIFLEAQPCPSTTQTQCGNAGTLTIKPPTFALSVLRLIKTCLTAGSRPLFRLTARPADALGGSIRVGGWTNRPVIVASSVGLQPIYPAVREQTWPSFHGHDTHGHSSMRSFYGWRRSQIPGPSPSCCRLEHIDIMTSRFGVWPSSSSTTAMPWSLMSHSVLDSLEADTADCPLGCCL